jgi:hypothetical protein
MMKTSLKLIGVFLLTIVVVGLIIPNRVDVRRSVDIKAPISRIHDLTNDLTHWPQWSPWIKQDPNMKIELAKITQGKGASQRWTSVSGNGTLTFTESSEINGIVYDMSFDDDPTSYVAGLSYQQNGEFVTVTWYMTGNMEPIIIGNYFSLLMDSLVGESFALGLANIKKLAEAEG